MLWVDLWVSMFNQVPALTVFCGEGVEGTAGSEQTSL